MTREQLKQVRDLLSQAEQDAHWSFVEDAKDLIDAELASEAREWRAVHKDGGYEVKLRGTETAQDWVQCFPNNYRLESRTPAGQWEAER